MGNLVVYIKTSLALSVSVLIWIKGDEPSLCFSVIPLIR